ncbi:MAG: acyl-[acyl-carrier-protein] thioesterase [Lachnospiraceae bacterium]|nr:acyl-[acyl-carrier-protein] thioesterase [Lachnospiraceae bacterium]
MYEYDIRIGYSRVDEEQKLSIPALIDIMQDCSTFQSEDLGLGISYCREKNVFWVLNSWQVEIDRLPELCEKVTVFTFPVDFNRFVGTRCFGIRSGNDVIVRAYSVWALLDTETYKPAPMTEDMIARYKTEEALPMGKISRKIRVPAGGVQEGPMKIEAIHLDANHHVNNGKFVQIAASYVPGGKSFAGFRAQYLAQAFLGDTIYPRVFDLGEDGYIVSLENGDGAPYAVMEFK